MNAEALVEIENARTEEITGRQDIITEMKTNEKTQPTTAPNTKVRIKDLDLFYGSFQALKNISMEVAEKQVTALIGPSGCGKSTFLKCINRMNDLIPNVRTEVSVAGRHRHRRRHL